MKKTKKTRLIAAILTAAAAGLAGCTDPPDEEVQDVYGPPPEYEQSEAEDIAGDSTESSRADSTDSEYSPRDEDIEEVYGPPEWFE